MIKRTNPYTRLVQICRQWAFEVMTRRRVHMFTYEGADVRTSWRLDDLYQRVAAAEQLGYDVVVTVNEKQLVVYYMKKIQPAPWEIRP